MFSPCSKIFYSFKRQAGIGLTDIVIGLVVASLLGILIYNIHAKYRAKHVTEAAEVYLKASTDAAFSEISKDLVNSQVFGYGCKGVGLLIAKNGDINSPDEIIIRTVDPIYKDVLLEDMENQYSQLTFNLGCNFKMQQELSICDNFKIERFMTESVSPVKEKGVTIVIPKPLNEAQAFENVYPKGSFVAAFNDIHYFVGQSQAGLPALIRKPDMGDEKIVAENIENIQFEYEIENSQMPTPEPIDINSIQAVIVKITARSRDTVFRDMRGINSLTGGLDNYKRLERTAKFIFRPVDPGIVKDLAFRIITRSSGEDSPEIGPVNNKPIALESKEKENAQTSQEDSFTEE